MPKWWFVFLGATLVAILLAVRFDPNQGKDESAATPTTGAASVANDYPADAVVRFESICTRGGGSLQACVCLIHGMENRYSYARFEALVAADNPDAPEYAVVAKGCVGT